MALAFISGLHPLAVRVALGTLATFLENGTGRPRKGNVGGMG